MIRRVSLVPESTRPVIRMWTWKYSAKEWPVVATQGPQIPASAPDEGRCFVAEDAVLETSTVGQLPDSRLRSSAEPNNEFQLAVGHDCFKSSMSNNNCNDYLRRKIAPAVEKASTSHQMLATAARSLSLTCWSLLAHLQELQSTSCTALTSRAPIFRAGPSLTFKSLSCASHTFGTTMFRLVFLLFSRACTGQPSCTASYSSPDTV